MAAGPPRALTRRDAAARRVVRLPDGATGVLVYVPANPGHGRRGKAIVRLPSGAHVNCDHTTLTVEDS